MREEWQLFEDWLLDNIGQLFFKRNYYERSYHHLAYQLLRSGP